MHIDLTINGHHIKLTGQLTPSGYFCGFDVVKAGVEIDRFEKIYISLNVVPDGFLRSPATRRQHLSRRKQLEAENYVEKQHFHDTP